MVKFTKYLEFLTSSKPKLKTMYTQSITLNFFLFYPSYQLKNGTAAYFFKAKVIRYREIW